MECTVKGDNLDMYASRSKHFFPEDTITWMKNHSDFGLGYV